MLHMPYTTLNVTYALYYIKRYICLILHLTLHMPDTTLNVTYTLYDIKRYICLILH